MWRLKMKINILILVLLLFLGCITPPNSSVPSDLEIRYSYGACQAEKGRTIITIDANGSGLYQRGRGTMLENETFAYQEFRKSFELNETELLTLINKIEVSGFYSLSKYYIDPNVMDGSCNAILVTKNNVTKSVAVSNMNAPEGYSKAADAIIEVAESKTK